ncbi:hypothetical protein DNTS_025309 [Danionella cerebrum]|uniref:I/LWEQ domain-containing protein n=1 Tax=Danionella cerebrum TaxID=2873325 RepID=A0A553PUY8_9TELE|nr:hypothetical protein DNTS_025309 [Danionella translucida]
MDCHSTSSSSAVGQCRLTPLVLVVLDCGSLYHVLVKLLFKLHSRESRVASLCGFMIIIIIIIIIITSLSLCVRNTLRRSAGPSRAISGIEFFKTIIQIPELPDEPPNFLRAASLADHVKPVVVQNQSIADEDDAETQYDFSEPQYQMFYGYNQFDPPTELPEQRETEADSLRKELEAIKPELQLVKVEAQRAVVQLKSQVNLLESELEDQRTHKQMALVENERLRMEVDNLRAQTAIAASVQATAEEAGSRAQTAQVHFTRLKEKHAELVSRHADLMRKNAELVKQKDGSQEAQEELKRYKQQIEQLREEKSSQLEAHRAEVEQLKQELVSGRAEMSHVHTALQSKGKAGDQLSSVLLALQAEKASLQRTVELQQAEISDLRSAAQNHQSSAQQERERHQLESTRLHSQLNEKGSLEQEQLMEIQRLKRELEETSAELLRVQSILSNRENAGDQLSSILVAFQAEKASLQRTVELQQAEISDLRSAAQIQQSAVRKERERHQLESTRLHSELQEKAQWSQKLQDEQFSLLQCAVVEAEGIVLDAVAKVDDPLHVRCISSPDYLINRAELTLASIDKMTQTHAAYTRNMDDASGLLRAVTQFSHLIADTIVNGAGAAHSAPTDQADCLTEHCRDCASECLQYLKDLKMRSSLPRANPGGVRRSVQHILLQGQDLRSQGADVCKEELADLVDKEMAATSSAIEDAVLRMDEILSQARRDTSGVKLEVNQSIFGSCSDLMKAIHMLVTAATDLQRDIVESGRGSGSVKDFYAKNSRWTEGLISASKAVGWGAGQMLESADKVAGDRGKYEELIVCSHEIAASTAQLVAASKVKADRGNRKLHTLQQASRHVNDMAAAVVRVLELEQQLASERVRLGELRKKHYDLGGHTLDSNTHSSSFYDDSFDPSLPTVFPDPVSLDALSLSTLSEQPEPEPAKASAKRSSIFQRGCGSYCVPTNDLLDMSFPFNPFHLLTKTRLIFKSSSDV